MTTDKDTWARRQLSFRISDEECGDGRLSWTIPIAEAASGYLTLPGAIDMTCEKAREAAVHSIRAVLAKPIQIGSITVSLVNRGRGVRFA